MFSVQKTSIIVTVEDTSTYNHLQPVVRQVDIHTSNNRIHVLWGVYGPDSNYDLQQKDTAKRDIIPHINRYTLFPK